jgi:hypothetical protein
MPLLSEIATNLDVVSLIVEQLGVADGLRLAAVSKSWRDSSRAVWGYAETLVTTQRLLIQEDAQLMSTPAFRNLQLLMMKETTNEHRLDRPGAAIMLGDDLCVVDSSYSPKMRRVLVFSPELELKRTIPCPAPLVYPDSLDCPGEGVLTNVAASSEHLYVAWYSPAGYGLAAIYKYRLSDFELVGKCDPNHKVSDDYDGTEDEHLDWDCYFHMPCDLAVSGERLFVCDAGGEFGDPAIVVFDLDMKYLATIGGKTTLTHPEGLAVLDGIVYVANSDANSEFAIRIFDYHLVVSRYMPCDGNPISIAFARGRMLVGCASKDVKCFTPDGVLLQTLKLDYMPVSLCVHDAQRVVYAADYSGANVKMLTYFNGEPEPTAAAGDDSGEAESVTEKLARETFEALHRRRGAGFETTGEVSAEGAACAERCQALIDDILKELERQSEEDDSSDDD